MITYQLLLYCALFLRRTGALKVIKLSDRTISLVSPTLANTNNEAEKFRESAKKLREEAEELESKLDRKDAPIFDVAQENPIVYKSLKGSTWTVSYRFASDPANDKDDNIERSVSNYSGKLTVKFLADGYSELLSHEPIRSIDDGSSITIEKVWGWDMELSNEDGFTYLLFSSNILLPPTDINAPNEVTRYYWQARVLSAESNGELSLKDGTVTMKKDIKPPGGFWGVFNGAGILAQFQYVGNFVAKPDAFDK